MTAIAFFNNKGGVGKTTLGYHLCYMFKELGLKVLAVDLDPQSNLTAMFLHEQLEEAWGSNQSFFNAVLPLMRGIGDIQPIATQKIDTQLELLMGDLRLSTFEDKLSDAWIRCSDGDEASFRIVSAFYRTIQDAVEKQGSDIVIIDVGPNLGAVNRAAMIAADFVITPVAPDLFSAQGLKNLGPTLIDWRKKWQDRLTKNSDNSLALPAGNMEPLGYIVMQHNARGSRPVKAYQKWAEKMPGIFHESVLNEKNEGTVTTDKDIFCLGLLKHYQSLMPMAMEVHKPIFLLKPADGAIGAHFSAVARCFEEFKKIAISIISKIGDEELSKTLNLQ
jgi:chromosome partitioning protein